MHVHTASTTLSKVEEALADLLPPEGVRYRQGQTETYDDDLVDLRVHYLGGRDVLAVAVHADHNSEPAPSKDLPEVVRVEHYGPDHRYFETEGGPAMPPDSAGLVEDVRRTWALWFGQDGRPTSLWLYRGADGSVIGNPIHLGGPADLAEQQPARTVTIRRQADGRDRFAFLDDDGHLVGEFVVEPRHVTLVHDRAVPPEWSGVWPE